MGLAQVRLEKHSPNHYISLLNLFVLRADSAMNATPASQALSLVASFPKLSKILNQIRYIMKEKIEVFNKSFWWTIIINTLFTGIFVYCLHLWFDNKFKVSYLKEENFINKKRDIYFEVLNVATKYLSADDWANDTAKASRNFVRPIDNMPSESEINLCVSKLAIYSDDLNIPLCFYDIIKPNGNKESVSTKLSKLSKLMRVDLGYGKSIIDTTNDNYLYIRFKKQIP